MPLKTSSTSFHLGNETNIRSLQREQYQKGILHAWMNICSYILVNISMKIQCEDAFSGQSHSDDRPMITHCHCYVSSLLHKHKEGKAQPTNVQQSFLLLLSSNHHLWSLVLILVNDSLFLLCHLQTLLFGCIWWFSTKICLSLYLYASVALGDRSNLRIIKYATTTTIPWVGPGEGSV